MLLVGVVPKKQAASGKSAADDESVFHFDVFKIEKFRGGKFDEQMHAKFCHQVVSGADSHAAHAWPCGHEPWVVEFFFNGHVESRYW